MTVLVLTDEFDPTADRVVNLLNDRDIPVFRCDTADFPQRLQLDAVMNPDPPRWVGHLRTSHRTISLADIRSVWYRRPTHFRLSSEMSEPETARAEAEARFGFGGVLSSVSTLWVNHPSREADASYKPAQLAAAQRCGLHPPRTLITNDPDAVSRFRAEVDGAVVTKMLGPAAYVEESTAKIVYTTKLSATDLDDLSGVNATAHLFQEWIDKAFEVRVTVVGDRCFAAEIYAHSADARVDWRSDYDALTYKDTDPPASVLTGIHAFMAVFDLRFGAFDFSVDTAGEWHFLECNTSGNFGWIEEATGHPISETLADLLANGREQR